MIEPNYFDQTDKAPCPYCGGLIEIVEALNDNGLDFEGAFLMAHPGEMACPHCEMSITPEPNLEWRIWKADEYNKHRSKWDKSIRVEEETAIKR